jgi:hypothetical protein
VRRSRASEAAWLIICDLFIALGLFARLTVACFVNSSTAVYLACTPLSRFWRLWRFWRNTKSITCVFSIHGDVPSPVVPAILFKHLQP